MNKKKVDSILKAMAAAGVAMGTGAIADVNVVYAEVVGEGNTEDQTIEVTEDKTSEVTGDKTIEVTEEQLIDKFNEQISVASDFVIYADTLTSASGGTCHIDGNICVEKLDNASEGIKTGKISEDTENTDTSKYSIVKDARDQDGNKDSGRFDYIEGGAILVVDGDYPVSEPNQTNTNDSSKLMVVEDANDASQVTDAVAAALEKQGATLSEDEKEELKTKITKELDIDNNLVEIAKAAQALADKDDRTLTGKDALNDVQSKIKNGEIAQGSTVTITIGAEDINNREFANGMESLYKNNGSVKIIINVSHTNKPDSTISFLEPMNNQDYNNGLTNYIWNFGDYIGKVCINRDMGGIIVAALGKVEVNASCDVRVIANTVIKNGQEMHQIEDETKPSASTSTSESTSTSTSTSESISTSASESASVSTSISDSTSTSNSSSESGSTSTSESTSLSDSTSTSEIPDDNVPLVELPEEPVPLTVAEPEKPVELPDDLVELPDDPVPLVDSNPETGDTMTLTWMGTAVTSLAGLFGAGKHKKKKDDIK